MKETEFSEVKEVKIEKVEKIKGNSDFANICEEYIYAFKNQFFDKENYKKVFKKITGEFSKNNKFCDRCLCSLNGDNNPEHPYLIHHDEQCIGVYHTVTIKEFKDFRLHN